MPPSDTRIVSNLFAYVVIKDEGETVLRRDTPIGTQPLIADSRDRARAVEGEARHAAASLDAQVVKLVRYKRDAVVDSFSPMHAPPAPDFDAADQAYIEELGAAIGAIISMWAGKRSKSADEMVRLMGLGEQALLASLAAHRAGMEGLTPRTVGRKVRGQ